jgi:hypothetical protein
MACVFEIDPAKSAIAAKALRDSLVALNGEDDVLLLDMIEGETNLLEDIDAVLGRMAETRVMIAGLETVTADLDARKRRFEERLKFDKTLIEQALMIAEIDVKIERPMATLFMSARAPKTEITTESDIPAEFWKAGEPALDKKALADALKAGRGIPGAVLSNAAPSLTIRVK